jgi:hypothetical protein
MCSSCSASLRASILQGFRVGVHAAPLAKDGSSHDVALARVHGRKRVQCIVEGHEVVARLKRVSGLEPRATIASGDRW